MKPLDWVAMVLVIVGALNWGLVGAFDFNLVAALLGDTIFASIVYGLVGLSGLYLAARLPATQRRLEVAHA